MADDACDGDRRAHRLGALDPGAFGSGRGTAAGLSAAGPGEAHDLSGWCAAGMVEAGKQFRRVNGHLHLPALRAALEREVNETVPAVCKDDLVNVA